MPLASCCGPLAPETTPDTISAWAVAAIICGALLLLEALAVAITSRGGDRPFWHNRFFLLTAGSGVAAMLYAWRAFAAYDALHVQPTITAGDMVTISQWAGGGCLAFWLALLLLCAYPWYHWMRRG